MDLNLKNKHPRRIYYLFLVIIFFLASTEIAHSQVKNLSLHLTNVTLEEALAQIKQKGEYSLWYRNEEINLKKKVSLDIKNGSITQILDTLLDFLLRHGDKRYGCYQYYTFFVMYECN